MTHIITSQCYSVITGHRPLAVMTVTLPRYPIWTHFLFRSYFYYLNLSRYVLYSYSLVLVLIDRKYITRFCLPRLDFRLVLDVHTSFHFFLNTNRFRLRSSWVSLLDLILNNGSHCLRPISHCVNRQPG
jgi:hypothetical protein